MNIKTLILIPIIFIVILSAVLTNFLISFEEKVFNEQSTKIENKIINDQKNSIKNSINNIISILNQKSESFKELQKEILKERTNNAIQLIDNIYKENLHLTEKELFIKIKQYLNFISSSDKSKYYYIYKMDGTCVSVPANRKLEGKNLIDLQDIKGQYVVKTIIKIAANGGGFNEWYYLNPKSNKIEKKIGYAVEYKPLNIFIGTAIYEQDIIKNIKDFSSHLLCDFKTSYGGYIFAYDDKGNTIAHVKKELIGINRWDLEKNGKFLLQELIETGHLKNGGFLEYEATINPKTKKPANKISFINEFSQLKWVIGTGFYTDELYADIKSSQNKLRTQFDKELQNILVSAISFTIILIILLWIILSRLSKKLIHYKSELESNNKKLNNLNANLEDKIQAKTKKLQSNLNVMTALLDSTLGGILISDENHKCIEINETALKMFKVTDKKEAMEQYIFNFVSKDSLPLMQKHMINNDTTEYEVNLVKSDKEVFPALVKGKTITLDGKSVRVSAMVDLSYIKEKELQLLQQNKMVAMGAMIGNIAHQWRQPLSVISTAASGILMSKEFNHLNDEQENEMLNGIIKNTQFLSETIDTFRNYIKDDKKIQEVILQERLHSAINIIESTLYNHHINLINNIDNIEPIKITLIVGELSQVIINLINNAKDILLETKEEDPFIKIDLEYKNDTALITIEDNGGGIPIDVLPNIFDPYFTTKHQSQGTGLGLHMSKDIIEKHLNGKLYAQNTKDGAIFIIELPLAKL